MTNNARVISCNVTLYPADLAIIGGVADRYGVKVSAAVRIIVRQWAEAYLSQEEQQRQPA